MHIPQSSTPLGPCSERPAIHLKLTQEAVDAILATKGKGVKLRMNQSSSSSPKLDLYVGDQAFAASSIPEANHVDLYKRNKTGYSCKGTISQRFAVQGKEEIKRPSSARNHQHQKVQATAAAAATTRSMPSSPLMNGSSKKTLPSKPLSQQPDLSNSVRLIHLLALKPSKPEYLAQRTGLTNAEVMGILNEYAVKQNDKYTLSDSTWKDVRIKDWKQYSSQDRQALSKEANAAFDRLKLPSDHPARKNLWEPSSPKKKNASPKQQPELKESKPEPTEPKESNGLKRKANGPQPAAKRVSLGGGQKAPAFSPPEDLFDLAKKFKKTYSEYEKLYADLSAEQAQRNKTQMSRLFQMHRDLQTWKKKLWDMTPASAQ